MTSAAGPIAPQRRHTLQFLRYARSAAPVYLDTEIDMTRVLDHRSAASADGRRYSVVAYVLQAAATSLVRYPEANAAVRGTLRPRTARYPHVTGKLALDKRIGGERVVLSALLPDLDLLGLDEIQAAIDHYRQGDPDTMPEFGGARLLHRLPGPLGAPAFRAGMRSLRRRPELTGTVSVSSLGHRPVDGFHSYGGTTVTIGVGRIAPRPVVREDRLDVAPLMRLSLSFDHRVIDGALAADVLAELKSALEGPWGRAAAPAQFAATRGEQP